MLLNSNDVAIKKVFEEGNVGVFSFGPLPTGFGHTLGNTLKRVLMTSLKGAAITQVKIDGAVHQFTTVPGVKEDVVELGLNFKEIRARIHSDSPVVGKIEMKGPGKVTAGDIEVPSDVEIVNKKQNIATLADAKAKFNVEVVFEPGVGYSPVEDRETSKVGVVLLDALFSPIVSASYEVEKTRKGTIGDLDKLLLSFETDGTVSVDEALEQSATILRSFFNRFADGEDEEVVEEEVEAEGEVTPVASSDVKGVTVDELPLPTRTINALKKAGISELAQLAGKTQEDLADIKNVGDKSIDEIIKLLEKEGLNKK